MAGFFDRIRQFGRAWRITSDVARHEDQRVLEDATKSSGRSTPLPVTVKAKHAGLAYNSSIANSTPQRVSIYFPPEYDLSSIANAVDTDSFFRRAVEKYEELIWKGGYKFLGKNLNAVNYVRKRFEQIAQVSDFPTEELLRQISYQLIIYGNCFISKVRNPRASGGKPFKRMDGKVLPPVAAYFVEDSVSMKVATAENGDVVAYKQFVYGKSYIPIWHPYNIIHMYYSRKAGLNFGTPLVLPVMDDIRALRKIEQNVELLIFQHTVPLYHYKVGTPEKPAADLEIEAVQATVTKMPPNGAIVTPERHEIQVIGAEKNALNVVDYLEYFKNRVLAGLGMSSVGMGEGGGASKSSAIVLDAHMRNTTETFQKVISMFVSEFMIKELLQEGGYAVDTIDEENKVYLMFPPIDKDAQWAKENHYAQMFTQHMITENEARIEFGRDPITKAERQNMYFELIAKPTAIIAASDEPYTGESKMVAAGKGIKKPVNIKTPEGAEAHSKKKIAKIQGIKQPHVGEPAKVKGDTPAARQGNSKNMPANQKRMQGPVKFPKNDTLDLVNRIFNATREDTLDAYSHYLTNSEEFQSTTALKTSVFDLTKKQLVSELALTKIEDSDYFYSKLAELVDELYIKIEKVFKITNQYDGVTRIVSIFDTAKSRIVILCDRYKEELVEDEEDPITEDEG